MSPSRLGLVVGVVGVGLLLVGVGDAAGRWGFGRVVVPLFLAGLGLVFGVCAWRLTGVGAGRGERLWVSVVLGVGLLASYVFRSPLIFDNFDELAHSATLVRLVDGRVLFGGNPMLPVSPYYPGIQLVTAAVRWLTGLPLLLDQMAVLVLARVVLVLCVFLIVERACGSARAGGVGVVVYAANPEFYSLGAQYGYQTLALAFAVAVVYVLFAAVDVAWPRRGALFALALAAIAAMVVSHHVTAWLTVGFLVVWAAGLRAQAGVRGGARRGGWRARRNTQAQIVGLAALAGVVLVGAWIAVLGHVVTGYIDPIVQAGARNIAAMVRQLHGNRTLFVNSAGGGTPPWESVLMLAAAVLFCLIIVVSLAAVILRNSVRGGWLRYLPAAVAAGYPLAMLSNISSDAKEIGARTTTFIFFGVAAVAGGWLARRHTARRRAAEAAATVGVAVICFLGSTLYGGGPLPLLVNGPYLVGAHERSLGAPSLALATWASAHLPEGSSVAADRDNAGLLNSFGQVIPISPLTGSASPARLFFDRQLTPADLALIRHEHIRYLITDARLTHGLPLFGAYIAPGETARPTRLTTAQLGKFNTIPQIYRIYDNGPIQVYDLSRLLGQHPLTTPAASAPTIRTTTTNLPLLALALATTVAWLWRLRRRAKHTPLTAHHIVCATTTALAATLFAALTILLTHLPPTPTATVTLLTLLTLALRPAINIASRPTSGAGTEVTSSYRRTQNALAAPNAVASSNGNRAPERLWSNIGDGPPIVGYVADSEHDEAAFVAEEVDRLTDENEATPGQVAVFYRSDAQSRVFEEAFIRAGLSYKVVGGVRFYERREVRDLLAYLRLIANPGDEVSLRRIVNVPRRGIGERAEACVAALAQRERVSFAAALARPADVPGLAARAVRSIEAFNELIDGLRADDTAGIPVAVLAEAVLERSGYLAKLQASADLQDARRIENLNELIAVAREFDATGGAAARRDPAARHGAAPEGSLADFLEQVSLVVDADQVPEGEDHGGVVTLMTLHTAKGRKFPVVFLTGLAENIFPHQRSAGDDKELEAEWRLANVGITCAERCLYRRAPARSRADNVTHETSGPGTVVSTQGFADDQGAKIDFGGGPLLEPAGRPPGRAHRARSQFVLGSAGLALAAVGASFAVAAAQREWVPPPELSIAVRQGEPVASVNLGTAAPIPAHLAVITRGRVLLSEPLSSKSGAQNVALPADVLRPGSRVLLVAGGRTIRNVYG